MNKVISSLSIKLYQDRSDLFIVGILQLTICAFLIVGITLKSLFNTCRGRENSTVVRVSVYEAGGPGSLPSRSVVIER